MRCAIARKLKIPRVIFPVGAGVMSALGLLVSPLAFEMARSRPHPCSTTSMRPISPPSFAALEREAEVTSCAKAHGVAEATSAQAAARHALPGPGPRDRGDAARRARSRRAFGSARQSCSQTRLRGRLHPAPRRARSRSSTGRSRRPGRRPTSAAGISRCRDRPARAKALKGARLAYYPASAHDVEWPVYDRYALAPGATITGPALIEERESTCVIGAGDVATVDAHCNLVATSSADRREPRMSDKQLRPRQPRHHVGPPDLDRRRDRLGAGDARRSRPSSTRATTSPAWCSTRKANSIAQGTFSVPSFIGNGTADAAPHAEALSGRDAGARRRHHHQRSLARHRPPLRHHRDAAGVPRQASSSPTRISITHLPDIGGAGYRPSAAEVYQEGLRIPICKLMRRGQAQRRADRDHPHQRARPEGQVIGDIMANVTCNEVGGRAAARVHGRVRARRPDRTVARDHRPVRARHARAHRGHSRRGVPQCHPGRGHRRADHARLRREHLRRPGAHRLRGDHALDPRAASTCRFATRAPSPTTRSRCSRSRSSPTTRAPPIRSPSRCPPGCILNALPPSSTGGRHVIGHFVAPLIFGALGQALPDGGAGRLRHAVAAELPAAGTATAAASRASFSRPAASAPSKVSMGGQPRRVPPT